MMRRGSILTQLVAMLALALFALPQGLADRSGARAGAATQSQIDQSHGILIEYRQQQRAQMPGDDTPDLAEQLAAVPARPAPLGARIVLAEDTNLLPATLHILPPVRGPPAV